MDRIPGHGLGKVLDQMFGWLRENLPVQSFACHSAPGIACSTAVFYFRNVDMALAFMQAFPEAELADGSTSSAHRQL
ncbi:hypothetical protein [Erythrobacter sp.]|uniref:hypothetical protein n=1 Tax=Erythrobacter sp. TaxID=1042 RepID=UPI0025EDD3EF|nr:hypothetical protein [Erythrobacter sp.]